MRIRPIIMLSCVFIARCVFSATAQPCGYNTSAGPRPCQQCDNTYARILQDYFVKPDERVLTLLVKFLNRPGMTQERERMVNSSAMGFFCALSDLQPTVRLLIEEKLDSIGNPAFRQVLRQSIGTTPDSLFAHSPLSPAFNDMTWGAYFATSNAKYLDLLLHNCQYHNNYSDRNLFLTGFTASWSLCSNARQYRPVRTYLRAQPGSPTAKLLVKSRPVPLQRRMYAARDQYHQQRINAGLPILY